MPSCLVACQLWRTGSVYCSGGTCVHTKEPAFALECALFLRLVAQLQRALGQVGSWEAAAKVLVSAEKGPDGQDTALTPTD
eukprot:1819696-Amphidinium_carterae.2